MNVSKTLKTTLQIIVIAIFFTNLFLFFYRPVKLTGDSGWHLKTGEWIVKSKTVPREDVFSFSEDTRSPWVVVHWLGSVLYYAIFRIGGYAGLKIMKAVLLIAPCILCFFFARKKIPLFF